MQHFLNRRVAACDPRNVKRLRGPCILQISYAEGKTEGGAYREPSEGSTRSKNLSMRRNPSHGNWEVSSAPEIGRWPKGALGKADGRNPEEQPDEKSDACIVPRNDPNNRGGSKPSPAEDQEGRRAAKRNAGDLPAPRTQSRTSASMEMDSVREAAGRDKHLRLTALMHHISIHPPYHAGTG